MPRAEGSASQNAARHHPVPPRAVPEHPHKPGQTGISVPQRATFEEQFFLPPFRTSVQAAVPEFLLSRDPADTRGAD